jgi:hypothetical protein
VVPEARRRRAAEQAREANLASRRRQQIFAANHVGDFLQVIVDRDDELIGPVVEAIAHKQIAALLTGILLLRPEELIEETLDARLHSYAPTHIVCQRNLFLAAIVWIAKLARALIADR